MTFTGWSQARLFPSDSLMVKNAMTSSIIWCYCLVSCWPSSDLNNCCSSTCHHSKKDKYLLLIYEFQPFIFPKEFETLAMCRRQLPTTVCGTHGQRGVRLLSYGMLKANKGQRGGGGTFCVQPQRGQRVLFICMVWPLL